MYNMNFLVHFWVIFNKTRKYKKW